MLYRIRISTTLFLILIICGILQIGSNGLSFWAFRDGQNNIYQVDQSSQQLNTLTESRAAMLQASTMLNKAGTLTALSYPPTEVRSMIDDVKQELSEADALFKGFMALPLMSAHDKALQSQTEKTFTAWHEMLAHQTAWLENNQLAEFVAAPVQKTQDQFDNDYESWRKNIENYVAAAERESQSDYHRSTITFVAMVLISVLLTVGALWWVRHMIVKPLAIISSHFEGIAKGNLARPVSVYGKNEISAIFAGLKTMQHSLRETVGHVREGSNAMHTGISEIAAGNNDLSARTEQQAASLAETAASMEQLTATVSQNADNARQASNLAHGAADTAKRGGEQASHVAQTMHNIATSSKKISDIISVIDGIAFQTNILALNAAVEAARAGEQGRGFAVVAGEVRNLASRSAQAAKEIKVLIEESVARVQEGSALVETSANTMTEIVQSVTRVNDIMGEIASASDEQRRGIEQVAQAVSQMDQVTQQNAALVEQGAAATEQLASQADHLTTVVSVFELDEVKAEAPRESVVLSAIPAVS
ncbi:methyl-accepting chemotaxis protein [Kluyvera cryocrescens]|uniref:methyl-accepting chemotaxis protein n=1 Tax=Kluyvera cryocrescens TaxID=580 RepID=UPI00155F3B40|nr:methyl-accepting chemotaxis protein [Kluyvera cryocrescens]MEB7557681.1 methyl-accepting chemotaxis protein [Kluyvera cryocrescens]MEB7712947.1 methyl-accepting chemotaxis protein [Kluyvera cryocrescens]WNN73439.1 methyl-accepting chemotaxis protein [Kluyvera cryocrescens]HAT1572200.1 HAMP domain-containing protein [Kluyvera cryocrescens]HDG1674076.1 Tar ligand binding domain-containing protein [Kluyvera cryocrescens]